MKEKTILVTGANSGIGRVATMELAKLGANIIMVCRNEEKAKAVQDDINAVTGLNNVDLFIADMSSHKSIKAFAKAFYKKYDQLDVLINNAGLARGLEPEYEGDFEDKSYTKKVFEQMPLIYREQGSGTRHVMEKFIKKNKLPVQKKMELTGNEAVKQAVVAGLGYSIMPLIGIKNELMNNQLRVISVKGFPIKSTWYLIWPKGKKLSPVAAAYLNYIKKEKQRIIQQKFGWFESYL